MIPTTSTILQPLTTSRATTTRTSPLWYPTFRAQVKGVRKHVTPGAYRYTSRVPIH